MAVRRRAGAPRIRSGGHGDHRREGRRRPDAPRPAAGQGGAAGPHRRQPVRVAEERAPGQPAGRGPRSPAATREEGRDRSSRGNRDALRHTARDVRVRPVFQSQSRVSGQSERDRLGGTCRRPRATAHLGEGRPASTQRRESWCRQGGPIPRQADRLQQGGVGYRAGILARPADRRFRRGHGEPTEGGQADGPRPPQRRAAHSHAGEGHPRSRGGGGAWRHLGSSVAPHRARRHRQRQAARCGTGPEPVEAAGTRCGEHRRGAVRTVGGGEVPAGTLLVSAGTRVHAAGSVAAVAARTQAPPPRRHDRALPARTRATGLSPARWRSVLSAGDDRFPSEDLLRASHRTHDRSRPLRAPDDTHRVRPRCGRRRRSRPRAYRLARQRGRGTERRRASGAGPARPAAAPRPGKGKDGVHGGAER